MSGTIQPLASNSREDKYLHELPQWIALVRDEPNGMANLANLAAALFQSFGWHWVGFYLVDANRDELVLGPFQGPVACTRLFHGRGVCAAAWDSKKPQLVPDVHVFPGHVACSAMTQSELVIPIVVHQQVVAVLDIDSASPSDFSEVDVEGLKPLCEFIGDHWNQWEF